MSLGAPGGNGSTSRIGFDGYVCAAAAPARKAQAAAAAAICQHFICIKTPGFKSIYH
jgi:hypothetical protein